MTSVRERAIGRRGRANVVLVVLLSAGTAIAACGGDSGNGPGSGADSGNPGNDADGAARDGAPDGLAAGDAAAVDGSIPDGPDVPPASFPSTTPLLFGYTLVDAYPAAGALFAAMDIAWPAGSAEPFYLHRQGYILRLPAGAARETILDFSNEVFANDEAGALGLALHPKFADPVTPKPYAYVWYNWTNDGGATTHQHLARFTYSTATKTFDPASELLLVDQTEGTHFHNGAHVRFGPDGFLYFGNGDDQRTDITAQTITGGLFSGLFRIDVDQIGGAVSHPPPKQPLDAVTQGYYIPNDNPFVGVANAAEEYFALGFRNPYSFNFDKANGAMWLGDVGDTWREEVDKVVAGGNYGWPIFEGDKRRGPGATTIGTLQTPKFSYTHASIGDLVSTMAGYVYRGAAMPELTGKFIFSDWPTGRVWALDTQTGTRTSLMESNWQNAPLGWGQDASGELYMVTWSKIMKLTRAPAPHTVPKKLSDTHFFRNLSTLKTSSLLVPYEVRSPLWSDGAAKQRWIYVPPGKTAAVTATGAITLPTGTMLVKQFDLPATAQPANGRTRRLETRVMVVGTDTTYGVSYRWNAAGTDADLMLDAIDEHIADPTPTETRDWHFPSQGECWSCHRAENRILGFKGEQLNFALADGTNQLTWLASKNVLDPASIAASPAVLASPADTTADVGARAGAYFAANCAPCHHPGASYLGGVSWNALPGVATADRGLLNKTCDNAPLVADLGLPSNAVLVAPMDPMSSILMRRISATDVDQRMPPLGRTHVDPVGEAAVKAWITAGAP